jgi:putative PIN family toxin of toxin-antitoxin system
MRSGLNATTKPIIVIDTQLILRAAMNRRSLPAKILFEYGYLYTLAVSPGIRAEVADVLYRPKLRLKFSQLSDELAVQILAVLDGGLQVNPANVPAISRDPKDDIFLATAIESKASYLVSEDQDLLVLHPYQQIKILNALDFNQIMKEIETQNRDIADSEAE